MWELVWDTQGMERVIRDTPKPVVKQIQVIGAKRRDFEFLKTNLYKPIVTRGKRFFESRNAEGGPH